MGALTATEIEAAILALPLAEREPAFAKVSVGDHYRAINNSPEGIRPSHAIDALATARPTGTTV